MSYEDYGDELHPQGQPDDRLPSEKTKDELIEELRAILHGDKTKENEDRLFKTVQLHRTLVLDIATKAYLAKPGNSKLLDSINTILAQTEKSARDDRKERAKDKELEDNRANFATFVNALNEISAGKISMPNYGTAAIILDPLAPMLGLSDNPDDEIKQEELYQGHQIVDSKEIEASFADDEDEVRIIGTVGDNEDDEDIPWDPNS